ncbi:MAG: hypothetical protein ACPLTR_10175 [Thermacetogeniaceae bacterium]
MSPIEKDTERILANPYDNVYWFARMLINTDKYGGIGSNTEKMFEISHTITGILEESKGKPEDEVVSKLAESVRGAILSGVREDSRKRVLLENLCLELEKKLLTIDDYKVLALTCEYVVAPITQSLAKIPNSDKEYVESFAKALLDSKGEEGLATIINLWDDLGAEGCLAAERVEAVKGFTNLKEYLDTILPKDSEEEKSIILSAFCQEFERRVGQKRKGRAGGSLETVTSFILNYFGIRTVGPPEHFTARLEIDRWVKCKDNWLVGISCKRTLRERWKQAYTTDVGLLDRHKIRSIWHVITYDRDLSDDKITEMGSHRVVFYLPDDSPRYKRASEHPGMKNYVRPITKLISDLKALI